MKTIWLSGASSGIGMATASHLASLGHKVVISARSEAPLQKLAAEYPDNIEVLPIDLCQANDIIALGQYFSDRSLDVAIINAGSCEYMDEAKLDLSAMRRVFEINVFAVAASIDALLPALKRSASGHIIGIASMSTYLPFPRAEYYGSSKAAMTYYLESLRNDVRRFNIDVTIANPGFVKTPLTDKNDFDMPFIISAERAARSIAQIIIKRPKLAEFPKRLAYTLKLVGLIPLLRKRLLN